MSSINTNTSAMNALSTLRSVNSNLNQTQDRISTGLKVSSAKDNASYFAISEGMKGDSGMTKAVNEGLTLTKNSIATARVGADAFKDLAAQFAEKVLTAKNNTTGLAEIETDLKALVATMKTTITQSTFAGDDLVNATGTAKQFDKSGTQTDAVVAINAGTGELQYEDPAVADTAVTTNTVATETRSVTTGITRTGGTFGTTSIDVNSVDLYDMMSKFEAIANDFKTNASAEFTYKDSSNSDALSTDVSAYDSANDTVTADGEAFLTGALAAADSLASSAIDASTSLGIAEKSIETQQEFLTKLSDNLDTGVGAMVDANMEEEAARLQALQVQQQLASQSLSIANQAPQNILSLFR
ncbi:flagellin [Sulfitobacter sp. R18_1]|uniref:flagellin n=1 Tax=Sulfitobacter sp. R18_1 TaxID=2821104 RepID=UPI001ADCF6EB|nr:flagellin [Sulfitobacter sp. R18_1]MBO9429931.1 flagellin [Sulfitobacter sp. R18_1]